MKKTIVFICLDEEYVNAIEYRFSHFVEKKADVIFITNLDSLNDFLTGHNTIDILIMPVECEINATAISNNIRIFYLTESKENLDNPQKIYKYCSIRAMIEKLGLEFLEQEESDNKKETKVIGVISASGGTGKTVAALSVAYGLRKKGNNVLYVSTTPYQDYSYYLNCNSFLSENFCYQCSVNIKGAVKMIEKEIKNEDFDYIPPFKNLPISYHIDFPSYLQFVDYFKRNNLYDYIIVELSSELQLDKAAFLNDCYKSVIVTLQDNISVQKTKAFLSSIVDNNSNLMIICNKYNKDKRDYLMNSGLLEKYEFGDYIKEFPNGLELKDIKNLNVYDKVIRCLK